MNPDVNDDLGTSKRDMRRADAPGRRRMNTSLAGPPRVIWLGVAALLFMVVVILTGGEDVEAPLGRLLPLALATIFLLLPVYAYFRDRMLGRIMEGVGYGPAPVTWRDEIMSFVFMGGVMRVLVAIFTTGWWGAAPGIGLALASIVLWKICAEPHLPTAIDLRVLRAERPPAG
jgi:hypothetical protein